MKTKKAAFSRSISLSLSLVDKYESFLSNPKPVYLDNLDILQSSVLSILLVFSPVVTTMKWPETVSSSLVDLSNSSFFVKSKVVFVEHNLSLKKQYILVHCPISNDICGYSKIIRNRCMLSACAQKIENQLFYVVYSTKWWY